MGPLTHLYAVHVHSLVTFGAVSPSGKWCQPTTRKRICKHRDMREYVRHHCLILLDKAIAERHIRPTIIQCQSIDALRHKTWSYRETEPTMRTEHIELYLARYINRIAVTNSRVHYAEASRKVHLTYNDYRNQKEGQPAPKQTHVLDPLTFMGQYLQHVPPPYYQRTRRYGLHSSAKKRKYDQLITSQLQRSGALIRTTMEIIAALLKLDEMQCTECGHKSFTCQATPPDKSYKYSFLPHLHRHARSPPRNGQAYHNLDLQQ